MEDVELDRYGDAQYHLREEAFWGVGFIGPYPLKGSFEGGSYTRVVQKPQFLNNFRLKNSKMRSILQDLFDNQPGY
jgi:hypothetical protein